MADNLDFGDARMATNQMLPTDEELNALWGRKVVSFMGRAVGEWGTVILDAVGTPTWSYGTTKIDFSALGFNTIPSVDVFHRTHLGTFVQVPVAGTIQYTTNPVIGYRPTETLGAFVKIIPNSILWIGHYPDIGWGFKSDYTTSVGTFIYRLRGW